MKVLMVASECVPFAKTGGLADVVGSLPKALMKEGCEIRVVLPKYGTISEDLKELMKPKASFTVRVGWRNQYCGLEELEYEGVHYYFIDNQYYFNRERLYDFYDEAERFTYFCKAALDSILHMDFEPDMIHCHDWQSALISVYMKSHYLNQGPYSNMKTMLTIHNLKYQGIYPDGILGDLLGLGQEHFKNDSLEFNGDVNFLKGGILYSDVVTTVSQTYAEEIKTPYYGENLDGVIRKRDNIFGIINGLDYDTYNPMTDPYIFSNYKTSLTKKRLNKEALQADLYLPTKKETPVISLVSRLVAQKGLDLIAAVFHELLQEDIQFIVLGTGEQKYEEFFRRAAEDFPDKVAAYISFDEALARKIYAGSDLFLMPSLYEPCGLSQLIALRYGTIPVVRETGGLQDTIQSYNELDGMGNGFTFSNYNAHDMLYTIRRALELYQDQNHWQTIVKNALKSDFSWRVAAREYAKLYAQVAK